MPTDPVVLRQLQDAWSRSSLETKSVLSCPEQCRLHVDPREWIDEPATMRPGWLRTKCSVCGAFIGFRPHQVKIDAPSIVLS